MMNISFKVINVVYWLALTLWVACIISAAVAAMGVFTTLPELGLTIEPFTAALGDEPAEHGRVAGGKVMEPIFAATDWLQAGAAGLVIVALVIQAAVFGNHLKSLSNVVRVLCILAAATLLAIHLFVLAPRMNRNLREYWQAIEHNDGHAMTQYRHAFNSDHGTADRLVRIRLLVLLGAVVFSAVVFTPAPGFTPAKKP